MCSAVKTACHKGSYTSLKIGTDASAAEDSVTATLQHHAGSHPYVVSSSAEQEVDPDRPALAAAKPAVAAAQPAIERMNP